MRHHTALPDPFCSPLSQGCSFQLAGKDLYHIIMVFGCWLADLPGCHLKNKTAAISNQAAEEGKDRTKESGTAKKGSSHNAMVPLSPQGM